VICINSEQNANKANSVLDVLLLAVSKPLVCLNQLIWRTRL